MPRIEIQTSEELFMGIMTPDTYEGICTGCEMREKKSVQGEYTLMWSFDVEYEGRQARLSRFTPLNGPGAGFTRQMLEGLEIDFEEEGENLAFDSDDAVDITCHITVNTREDDNGQQRNEVQAVSRRNPGAPANGATAEAGAGAGDEITAGA